jgi:uncharacterized membrane protein
MLGRLIFMTIGGAMAIIVVAVAFAMTSDFVITAVAAIIVVTLLYAIRRVWTQHFPAARRGDHLD